VLEIERQVVQNLFRAKQIKESTVYEFEGELDLQQDAIEYANLAKTRATYLEGKIDSQLSFRKRLAKLRQYMASLPLIKPLLQQSKARLITERLSILHVRIVASTEALAYLHEVAETMKDHHYLVSIVQSLIDEQEQLRLKNEYQLQELAREYQKVYQAFEQELVRVFAFRHTA
jgi:hypothetical protein